MYYSFFLVAVPVTGYMERNLAYRLWYQKIKKQQSDKSKRV